MKDYTTNTIRPFLENSDRKANWCANMLSKVEEGVVKDQVRERCAVKHPDSYDEQAQCLTSEMDGWRTLNNRQAEE